jgi:hypothetical protein
VGNVKDKDGLVRIYSDSEISLGEERDADEEEVDFMYNHELVERIKELHAIYDLRELMYPKYKESEDPPIMDDVEAFRYGFRFPESAHRNLTRSTLTKILKNFVDFGNIVDDLFILGNVRFLTELFDLEEVREQVKTYITNRAKITNKTKDLVVALEYMLNYPWISDVEKHVVSELLGFLNE